MLVLQDDMNCRINPKWLDAGSDFLLAAMMEAVEAIDHHGWKWWKKQDTDMKQLQMELVDIWHFIMSGSLVHYEGDVHKSAANMLMSVDRKDVDSHKEDDLITNLKMAVSHYSTNSIDLDLFFAMVEQSGMSTDDLYLKYIGKNTLNFFRQDNGYKEGTYVKVWDGQEDNEYLGYLLSTMDSSSPKIQEALYDSLQSRYSTIVKIQ